MDLRDSPASIVRQALTDAGKFTHPDNPAAWPAYVSVMPDQPDNCAALYDTPGIVRGAIISSRTVVEDYGVQLKVRGFDYPTVYGRINAAVEFLRGFHVQSVVIGGNHYKVDAILRASTVMSLGQDEKRRAMFSVNLLLALLGSGPFS